MKAAVEIEGLNFAYRKGELFGRRKRTVALRNANVTIRSGSVCGIVGHNGAGKTTLLLVVAGLKQRYNGVVNVFGVHSGSRKLLPKVGILTDRLSLQDNFRVHEVLRMFSKMHRKTLEETRPAFERLGLVDHYDKEVKELSSGLRKRLAIAVAVMHDPMLVLLDEPFAGLDPESVSVILETIKSWKSEGKTVLVSSHDLHELEEVIDELVVIREGTVLASGSFFDLINRADLSVKVAIETIDETIEIDSDAAAVAQAMDELAALGRKVLRVTTKGGSLSDLYAALHDS